MTSQIDPTLPIFGTPTTASVRQNFKIAHDEITALQGMIGTIGGAGGFAPPLTVVGTGTITLPTDANYFVFVNNTTAAPVTVGLPNGNVVGQQLIIKDVAGNAGTYTITVSASAGIDGMPNYPLMSDYSSLSVVWTVSGWRTF